MGQVTTLFLEKLPWVTFQFGSHFFQAINLVLLFLICCQVRPYHLLTNKKCLFGQQFAFVGMPNIKILNDMLTGVNFTRHISENGKNKCHIRF